MSGLEQFSLEGKVAVVTGSSRGIGRAIAEGMAGAGAAVTVNGRNPETAQAVAGAIASAGGKSLAVSADVSKAADIDRLIQTTLSTFGRLDILVTSAGISPHFKPPETMAEAEWDEVIAVNLKGVFLCCQAAGRVMIPQKSGRIINISSIGGQVALPRLIAYCAAKGGVDQLTRVLAVEWAPHHILVNAISPGYIETDLTKGLSGNVARRDALLRQVPLGRLGKPEEIVGAAIYLASDAASFVTGQTLNVDGGWLAL
ncbi:MAG TPA: 3-oxoacyl-ACP reductase family protein [Terriglobia bacterium]|nr:3-oxoacyl-ACP reductase family protein [Terriglobia bacterium]